MIAALYVDGAGAYVGLDDVDPWPIERDARRYPGPWPVVAHPPCNAWCQLAAINAWHGRLIVGQDGGTFAAALAAVRRWGGVLEHPAYSLAWSRYGLPVPGRGGWTAALDDPGVSTSVCQSAYGHPARKRTWLYAVGVDPPALDWSDPPVTGRIGAYRINRGERRVRDHEAIATPPAFRDALLGMARSVQLVAP